MATDGDYRRLFEQAHDAVFITSREGRVQDANPAAAEMYGLDREELIGARALDFWCDPAERERFQREVEERGSVRDFRACQERADGTDMEVLINAVVRRNGDGEVVGYQGILRDVTKRVRAREALETSRERYRRLLRSAPIGIAVHVDGHFRYLNPRGAGLLGADEPDQLMGEPIIEFVHPEDRERTAERLRIVQEEREAVEPVEVRVVQMDGTVVHVEVRGIPVEYEGEPAVQTLARDMTEEVRLRARLQDMAYYDSLTGLANRRLLREKADQALREAKRQGRRVALLFLDLQRFKAINDSFGHEAGDRALVEVASRLTSTLRGADVVARVGGDEFAVLLTEAGAEQEGAVRVARRIMSVFDEPFSIGGREVHLGGSIGIANHPDTAEDFETLLAHADMAMYEAARERGTTFQVYRPSIEIYTSDRLELEEELYRALEEESLELLYQPVVRASDRERAGWEALARWRREGEELEEVRPSTFVALAEETGLVRRLDEWVLETAARRAASRDGGSADGWVAVNVSGPTLHDPDLARTVSSLLDDAGLPTDRLVIEVSEAAAVRDFERAADTLRALRGAGVRVALDDFGTGHSTLQQLKHLPVDILKIDAAFVGGVGEDLRDDELIRAVLGVGDGLGLTVVAEGVEEEAQRGWLVEEGCDLLQGFLVGRPGPLPAGGGGTGEG